MVRMRRGIGYLITALIIVSLSGTVYANELNDAKKKLDSMNNSINQNKNTLNQIQKDKQTVESQVRNLDARMNATTVEINKLKVSITKADGEIKTLIKEIEDKQKEIECEEELLDRRLSALYKSGTAGYINVIIGSSSLSDMLERAEVLKRIINYDKKLIESIRSSKASLEHKKEQLEIRKAELSNMKAAQDKRLAELKEQSDEKKNLVSSLEKDRVQYQKIIDQEEADAKALREIIKRLEQTFKLQNGKMFCVTGKPYRITSDYGWRVHPVLGIRRFHSGIDIAVNWGTPLYALMEGLVVFSGSMSGYGNVVMINHGEITSLYAHNSSNIVKEGQVVKGGQLIAYSGNTGVSSGPHLHFEIRKSNGETIDPKPYYVR